MTVTSRLITADDPRFEQAVFRRVFNTRRPSDRRPAAVLLAEDEQDVIDGVRWARANGLRVAVRSGGHSWAVWSVQNDTLLIDLERLNQLSYDDRSHVVSAGPSTKGGSELDPFLAERGRFFPGGHCPTVGIGGFLLQGGQGWNQRGLGWAAEYIEAVDVVTADGELLHCTADQHSELYWAARGAGPSFPGIVVRFSLRTVPRFGTLGHSVQIYEIEDFETVFTWLQEIEPSLPDTVEIVAVSQTDEQLGRRVFLVSGLAFVERDDEAVAALAPFQSCPVIERAIVNEPCRSSQLSEHRDAQLRANPEGHRWFTDNIWAQGDFAEVSRRLAPLFTELPEPKAFTIWMGNGLMRALPDMAFSLQAPGYVACYLVFEDEAHDERNRHWLNQAMAFAQAVTVGQYLGDSDMTNRQLRFVSDEHFARLQRIIAEADPDGVFVRYLAADPATVNQNHWNS